MRIVYFGSGAFGLPSLERLAEAHDVALVVTQPDRPAGRRRRPTATPAAERAAALGLETLKPPDVNDRKTSERIRAAGAEGFVVIAFGQKLGPGLLGGTFAINLHASLLPRYRGAAPINWAIINGERETGVSVIAITQRIDAGDVLGRRATPIDPMETAGELEQRLAQMGPDLMVETIDRRVEGTLQAQPQDERLACRAPRLAKADGTTRFDRPADEVRRRVHGLTPWPGCTVRLGAGRLKLTRAAVTDLDPPPAAPGRLLPGGEVACAPGRLRLVSVQPPGGRCMPFADYVRGRAPSPDAVLEPL